MGPPCPGSGAPLPAAAALVVTGTLLAPWALGFCASGAAVADHIAFALTFAPIALLITAIPVAAVVTGVAGAWLAAGPWLLGYASFGVGAWGADLVAGLTLVGLSYRAVRAGR